MGIRLHSSTSGATAQTRPIRFFALLREDPAFLLLCVLLCILWLAGGASREDALGQAVVRSAAWFALVVAALFGRRPAFGGLMPVVALLGVTALLPMLQLIPLPPALWQALPGRDAFIPAAGDAAQPWRPWSLVRGATWNAAASLVVPATVLLLVAQMRKEGRAHLPEMLFGLVIAALVLALVQVSAGGSRNPFINETAGQVGGPFANRNHFALFMALGCLMVPVWTFRTTKAPSWRIPAALGLLPLLLLSILASGSRAGLLLGGAGLILGLALVWGEIRHVLRRYPRWVSPAALAGVLLLAAACVLVAVAADRAVSIQRVMMEDGVQDMRRQALPVVIDMIGAYFPAGSGLGGFDPLFRLHEPLALLRLTYFNHAHNDFLEIAAGAGVLGILALIAALGWWAWASFHAWRHGDSRSTTARLGSTMLLLIFIASVFDYPARTPIVMTVITIAGIWLAEAGRGRGAALPASRQHL